MAKYLPLPDGNSVTIREGETPDQAWQRAQQMYPASFGITPPEEPIKKGPESGFMPALKAGYQNLRGDLSALAGKTGITDIDVAEKEVAARRQKAAEIFKPTEDSFSESPLAKIKELAGGSLPYMVAPVAAGAAALALPATAPAALIGTGLAGAASAAQFTGSNLGAQMNTGKTLKETELGSAALAAVPQAALDMVGLKMIPGVRQLFAAAGKEISEQAAKKIADQGMKDVLKDYGSATIKTMGTEGLTEAGQQVFERLQAGLAITDEKARNEYLDSFIGGAVLGGTLAPAGRYVERSGLEGKQAMETAKERRLQSAAEKAQADAAQKAQIEAEAQAEAERKADPAYAGQFLQNYDTLFQEFKALDVKKPGKDATFEDKAIYQENKAKKAELYKQLTALTPEYRQLKAAKAEIDAQAAKEAQVKADEEMMRVPGAQADMFGSPVMTDMTQRPPTPDELPTPIAFTQKRSQLLGDREAVETKLAEAKTTDEQEAALTGLDNIDNQIKELDALRPQVEATHGPIPKFSSALEVDAALVKAQKKLMALTTNGASTDADKNAIRNQLAKVKELEQNQSLFGPGNARPADEAKLAAEIASGRETERDRQNKINTEAAKLGKIGENFQPTGEEYTRDARQERQTQNEALKMEDLAEMNKAQTAQYTLFGGEELSSDQRSGTGALSTTTPARLRAALQIARATGNRQGVADAVAALRDLKAQQEAQAGAGEQTYSFGELQKTIGQKVPENVAAQQEAADKRDTAYANVVDIVSKYNQGKAKKEALDRARDFLIENLAKDIETSRGKDLTTAEQLQVQDQANKLLDELVGRFGDTRNVSSVGTKLNQAFQPAQNEDGTFNTDAVPGMGNFTAESKGPGYRTFASPYAAAMSIQEGLDSIRNKGVEGRLGATAVEATPTPTETTPDMVTDQLNRVLNSDITDADRQISIQIADNLKALANNKDSLALASDWLYRLSTGKAQPATSTGTGNRRTYTPAEQSALTKDVKAMLAETEQGKRSETETPTRETAFGTAYGAPKTAVQEQLPGMEPTGTTFATAKEFDEYLASDALDQIRKDQGLVTQTVSRLKAVAAPFAKKAEGLRAQLAALQARYAGSQKVSADEVDLAKVMSAEAKANLKAVIDRLDAELHSLQTSYIQANTAFNFAVSNAEEISANIEANARDYTEPQRKALSDYRKAKRALSNAAKLGPTPDHPKAKVQTWAFERGPKERYTAKLASLQVEVVRATQAYRAAAARSQTQQAVVKFLDVDLNLQMQLQNELAEMDRAGEDVLNAGVALELAKQKQDRSRKNKAAIKLATSDVNAALQIETEAIAAANAKKAAEVAEINAVAQELADAEKEASKADTIAERQRKQRERDNEALYTETIYDREERDRQLRRLENEARERLATIPGERLDFSKRREMLNVVDSARETEDEINQNIADAQQALDQIAKNIELQTDAISNAKVTIDVLKPKKRLGSKQQAELDRAEQNLEDATKGLEKSREHKKLFEGVIDKSNLAIARLSDRVTEINDAFSNDPEIAAKVKKSVEGRIATRRRKILGLSQKLNKLRDNEKNKEARTKTRHELAKLKREVRGLERLVETQRGLVRTTVGVTPDAASRLYDIAANTALPDTVREAAQAKITLYEEKLEAESLTKPPAPTREDETEEAEAARKQLRAPKRGPLVKDVRTGKVSQAGKSRTVTGLQAQRGAVKDVAFEQAMLQLDKLSDLRERLETAREKAIAENNTARLDQLNVYEKTLDKEQKQAEKDISKYRPVLRTAVSSSGPTLQSAQVTRIANAIVKDWAKVPNIEVVDSVDDLLPRIQTQLREENEVATEVPGLYDPQTDTVFLISSALRNGKDVELTVMHEIAGHYGLRNMLGSTYTQTMNDLYDGNSAVKQKADAKLKANPKLTRQIAVEEVLADAAENSPYANQQMRNALRRFVSTIKQWLFQKLGLKNISDFEVLQLVADSRRYVRQGIGGKGGDVTTSKAVLRTTQPKYESENALTDLAGKIIAKPKTLKERMGMNLALEAEMNTVDMRAGLREALKVGAKAYGDQTDFVQAMYNVTKADQKMSVVQAVLSNGPLETYVDDKGYHGIRSTNKNSAAEIFKAISDIPGGNEQGKVALATTYMIAQRAANKGLKKLDVGALGVTEAELEAAMAAAKANPALGKALEHVRTVYNAYNKGMIEFLSSTGAIPKATAQDLLKNGDYVPFYRVNENGMADLTFGNEITITLGDIRRQPYLNELKGGETRILPLTESVMRNTLLLTDKALTNLATKNVAYAMQSFGAGHGPRDKEGKPTNAMAIHRGMAPAGSDIVKFNQEPDPKDPKDTGQRWVRVRTEGTPMEGIPSELVVKSLEGAHMTLPAFLKIGGMAGDILRAGVTRTPIYLARQLIRDPMAASFTGGLNYGPLRAVAKAGKEFVQMTRGKSEAGAKLIEKGLIQSGIFTGDMDDMAKFALQLSGGKNQGVIDSVLAMADRAAMRADAATRALVYDNAIKNGLSEVEADMMTMESMNFHKRGLSPSVQYASRLIPFLNAQIQGLNVLYKAATGKMPFEEQQRIQKKFFNNGMLLVGTGIVYAMAMEDDEYYKNAKPRDRYTSFFLPIPGMDEPFKLPIPYEAGWFFSLAVAAVDAMKAETDNQQQFDALRDMFLQSIPGYSSKGIPQVVKPLFEVFTNTNFFTGGDLESARLQKLSPQERFNASTTEAAKALSRALPILSPIQIEHLATGYFGQLPLVVMGAASALFKPEATGEAPTSRVTDLPLIGSSFQKKYGGAESEVMYREAAKALEAKASYDSMRKQGRAEEAKSYLEDNRVEIAAAGLARNYIATMGRLRADQDRITAMPKMSGEEKRARINKLDEARQDVTNRYTEALKRVQTSVDKTTPR